MGNPYNHSCKHLNFGGSMDGLQRHRVVYKLIRALLIPYLRLRFHYRCQKSDDRPSPALILANHNTDWDPMFISIGFPSHMYFVASEHIFHWGVWSRLINYLAAPIPRAKATNDTRTVKKILRALNAGINVCVFAEGDRSFNGETTDIAPAIGKLAKQSGVGLITYRLSGGYFTQPRWGHSIRKGPTYGMPAGHYTKEELAEMTDEQVNERIRRDLYVNAFDDPMVENGRYVGKQPSEHLEIVLYCCPACGSIATITTSGDRLSCSCGLSLRYNTLGRFETTEGEQLPFETILEWDQWQQGKMKEILSERLRINNANPIFADENQTLYRIKKRESEENLGTGRLSLFTDRLEFQPEGSVPQLFLFRQIAAMAVHGRMSLVFSTDNGDYYELRATRPRSATKYMECYRFLLKRTLWKESD
ncbi:MAG: hypothetical protein CVU86_03035 [Firmicutes bacterium HGW-Firmicutes-11]|nr:MAG: hypothetical protein CVU86_03035 [Firmicutes bacterium HGW-Firmicutes-11]